MKDEKKEKKKHKVVKSKNEKNESKLSHVRKKIPKAKETDPKTVKSPDIPVKEHEAFVMPSDDSLMKDYPKTCHPIRFFVDDRAELIEQLFSTVRTVELQKILPETLKSTKIEELKKMCLQQAEVMSRDLVLHILAGKDPAQFTEKQPEEKNPDVTSSEQGTEAQRRRNSLKRKPEEDEAVVSSTTETCSSVKRRTDPVVQGQTQSGVATSAGLELFPSSTESECSVKELDKDKDNPHVVESIQEPVGELLELEMRARAIRSFLKAKGFSSSEEDDDAQSDLGNEDG